MRREVSDQGVLIPRRFLEGIKEVEIRRGNGVILIVPLPSEDPILKLGQEPIVDDVSDASEEHDRYVYKE